jgi:hypothetical protein
MAKSLRAKTKVRYRGIKRATVWGDADKARSLRIAEKLHGKSAQQILEEQAVKAEEAKKETEKPEKSEDVEMKDSSTKEPAKVSTSGWRNSRHDIYKKSKAKKASLVFKKRGSKRS